MIHHQVALNCSAIATKWLCARRLILPYSNWVITCQFLPMIKQTRTKWFILIYSAYNTVHSVFANLNLSADQQNNGKLMPAIIKIVEQ